MFLLFSFKHPFYLSVTDLKYNIKEKTVQGSLKVFVNDFEIELSKVESRKIDLLHPKDSSLLKQQIGNYLLKHFKMNVNSNSLDYKILGFEKEEEAFWIYIESKVCPIPKTVNIENSILFETIKDQINIIQIEVNLNKQSFKQNHPQKNFNFVF